ncbi:MAG: protein kinase [Planctomycetota bacterium]
MEAQFQVEEGRSAGRVLVVELGQTKTIGRGPGADLTLDDAALAPRHAAVRLLDDGLQVVDLAGGALLNEAPLALRRPTNMDPGDLIRLGGHALRGAVVGGRRRLRPRQAALPFPPEEFADPQRVGAGASGVVYRARWVPRGAEVALKLLREDYAAGTPHHARFLRECSTVAKVRCPYVVAVFDVRSDERAVYLVMELVEGVALDALLARGPLPLPAALRAGEDVARALAAAAQAGVVHRDVKPANVLVDRRAGVCRLCDFGLAKDLGATLQTLTALGVGLGTLAYLPPEQVSDARGVTPAADVYSLGATLFHAVAGQAPFRIDSDEDLRAVLDAAPPRLERACPAAPPELADLVAATLRKDPAQRPGAAQVADALARLRAQRFPGWDPRALFS